MWLLNLQGREAKSPPPQKTTYSDLLPKKQPNKNLKKNKYIHLALVTLRLNKRQDGMMVMVETPPDHGSAQRGLVWGYKKQQVN